MYGLLEWEKPGKLHVVLQRFKADRKQIRRGQACAVCRKNKRRCDGQRPCRPCIIGKCEEKCLASEDATNKVERPLHYESDLRFRDDEIFQMSREKKLKYGFLKGFWDMGFSEDRLNDMFKFLPTRLQNVYKSLNQVFEAAIEEAANAPQPIDNGSPSNDTFDVAKGERWTNSVYCGWLNIQFDASGKRSKVAMNSVCTNLWGAHSEEVMSRCGNQDLPLPMSEFRALTAIFDEFWTFMQGTASGGESESKVRYIVIFPDTLRDSPAGKKPLLFRETWQRIVRNGVPRRTTQTYVPVSAEQYDRALQAHPAVRNVFMDEHFCMLGSEIEACPDLWEAERIENMMKSPGGRAKLERLADLAYQMFQIPEAPACADRSCAGCSEHAPKLSSTGRVESSQGSSSGQSSHSHSSPVPGFPTDLA